MLAHCARSLVTGRGRRAGAAMGPAVAGSRLRERGATRPQPRHGVDALVGRHGEVEWGELRLVVTEDEEGVDHRLPVHRVFERAAVVTGSHGENIPLVLWAQTPAAA